MSDAVTISAMTYVPVFAYDTPISHCTIPWIPRFCARNPLDFLPSSYHTLVSLPSSVLHVVF
jgi:hypothetical protein